MFIKSPNNLIEIFERFKRNFNYHIVKVITIVILRTFNGIPTLPRKTFTRKTLARKTITRIDTCPNGHFSDCALARIDICPNPIVHLPE